MPTITLECVINAPLEKCFDLARDVEIHTHSTFQTEERAIAGVVTGLLGPGDWVTWEGTHFGIRQRLTVKITDFERPNRFVDEMVRGAFKELVHTHEFIQHEEGTLMRDSFYFRSPFGPLGLLADRLLLKRYLTEFLKKRNCMLKKIAEQAE